MHLARDQNNALVTIDMNLYLIAHQAFGLKPEVGGNLF